MDRYLCYVNVMQAGSVVVIEGVRHAFLHNDGKIVDIYH